MRAITQETVREAVNEHPQVRPDSILPDVFDIDAILALDVHCRHPDRFDSCYQ